MHLRSYCRRLLLTFSAGAWLAGSTMAAEPELTPAQIARAREAAARDRNLAPAEKQQVLALYDSAAKSGDSLLQFRARKIGQERRLAAVLREKAALAEELLHPRQLSAEPGDPDETAAAVEEALARAFVERNAYVRILNDLSHSSSDLAKRREEINQSRGQIRREEERVDDELAAMQIQFGSVAWEAAAKVQAAARMQAIQAEKEALSAESATLDAMRVLIPLRRDMAKLQLEASERSIELLKVRSRKAQTRDAKRELDRALGSALKVQPGSPTLQTAAQEVTELAGRLWSGDGVLLLRHELEDRTEKLRRETLKVEGAGASMRRRYEAGGRFAPAVEWLQGLPHDLPRLSDLNEERHGKLLLLAQLRRDTLGLEDRLQGDLSLEAQMERVQRDWAKRGIAATPGAVVQARQLLQLRRDLIEDTLKSSQELEAVVTEFNRVSAGLIARMEGIRDFAQQRALWARSTIEPLTLARPAEALSWFLWNRDWKRLRPASALPAILVLAATVLWAAALWMRRGTPGSRARRLAVLSIPLLLGGLAWTLGGEAVELGRVVKGGLSGAAVLLAVLLTLRDGMRPEGRLARLFEWPEPVRAALARDLGWLAPSVSAAWFFVRGLADAGHPVYGSAALQTYHGSLGRLCFLVLCGLLLAAVLRLFNPGGAVALALKRRREESPALFPADRLYGSLPIAVPALLALGGFYATALVLATGFFYTALLTVGLLALSVMLRRRFSGSIPAARNGSPEQVRRLAHAAFTVVWVGGALAIWSDVFPAVTMLREVHLGSSLTLLTLLEAVAAAMGYVILVRNLPGLLDFLVVQRLRLHEGTVYAFSTISRYVLVFAGVATVSKILGVNWSQIQWLAAALTFGIGFGLQEVFANLASGVILLLDRSIRVGDAVSVGEWSGRVAKIQMRATTVTLWNRSEMVVPNKEFISGKLINWTLSLPESRVDLKVGVAYGSDLDLVREVLHQVAAANPNVLPAPPPQVLLTAFGENAILFELQAFCLYEFGRQTLLDQLHSAVYREFAQRGIRIASPRLDIRLLEESS